MKTCNRCSISKDESAFYKAAKTKDGLQHACKECCKPMHRAYNARAFESRKSKRMEYQQTNGLRYNVWKAQQKCALCEESTPCCLDLHHLDPAQKEVTISNVVQYWSWKRLKMEIDKCIVVCSNCHRKIHAGMIHLDVA